MILIYVLAIVIANLTVFYFGPWFSPINSFFLIGLDLSLRDKLHDRWVGDRLMLRMGGMILAAGAISWILNPSSKQIAIASVIAFMVSSLCDSLAYSTLIRKPFLVRSNGSNVAGAIADSILFPTLTFGVFIPEIIALQFMAKTMGGVIWCVALHDPHNVLNAVQCKPMEKTRWL